MKLIDELLQELPKIGGWPEGAVAAFRVAKEGFIRFRTAYGDYNWLPECVDGEPGTVSREEYHAALMAISGLCDFESLARPLIKWLNDNGHPHQTIIIDATSAVLYSGEKSITTEEFIKD